MKSTLLYINIKKSCGFKAALEKEFKKKKKKQTDKYLQKEVLEFTMAFGHSRRRRIGPFNLKCERQG